MSRNLTFRKLPRGWLLLGWLFPGALLAQVVSCPEPAQPVGASPPAALELKCALADGTAHGPWLSWYESGQLMSRRNMRNGREHGLQQSWWPNGEPMMQGISFEGHRYPGFEYWDAEGNAVSLGTGQDTGVAEQAVPNTDNNPTKGDD